MGQELTGAESLDELMSRLGGLVTTHISQFADQFHWLVMEFPNLPPEEQAVIQGQVQANYRVIRQEGADTVAAFIDQIAIDPTDSRYIYLAVGREPEDEQGIYRSSDGGQSYTRLVTFTEESRVAVAVSYSGTLFATFDDTLWRSYDHGDSWQELPNARDFCGEGGASYIGFHPTVSQTLFLGYEADFACRSDDEGLSWYPACQLNPSGSGCAPSRYPGQPCPSISPYRKTASSHRSI